MVNAYVPLPPTDARRGIIRPIRPEHAPHSGNRFSDKIVLERQNGDGIGHSCAGALSAGPAHPAAPEALRTQPAAGAPHGVRCGGFYRRTLRGLYSVAALA